MSASQMSSVASVQLYQRHFQSLQIHFRGQLRAQLKPLANALGIGEGTIRNNGNIFKVNDREVRPSIVNGRMTFDLSEVADALAAAAQEADPVRPVPKVHAARGRGAPRKAGLVAEGVAA